MDQIGTKESLIRLAPVAVGQATWEFGGSAIGIVYVDVRAGVGRADGYDFWDTAMNIGLRWK